MSDSFAQSVHETRRKEQCMPLEVVLTGRV